MQVRHQRDNPDRDPLHRKFHFRHMISQQKKKNWSFVLSTRMKKFVELKLVEKRRDALKKRLKTTFVLFFRILKLLEDFEGFYFSSYFTFNLAEICFPSFPYVSLCKKTPFQPSWS